jgi:hypothetical protein
MLSVQAAHSTWECYKEFKCVNIRIFIFIYIHYLFLKKYRLLIMVYAWREEAFCPGQAEHL